MYKKLALFLFATATALSATVATARPPFCDSFCFTQYKGCINSGKPQDQCAEQYSDCITNCS
ncbi:hypothetical protein MJ904_11490 [Massilia sp. MB5]|uniref:hypothetical protein n=1 Tax=unclassified Massilia TaxID=2609279 RepID=UPI00067DE3B7|nr:MULTISPECIES: hypothetical protein [unclassified Massilia]AKU22489.1 hypothetical protein ACZ75_14435 [Massilia sp. NR 4-1]UMR32725.1 hypothetical protein MJ904_11490 [Massilia sp. MB5]